MTGARPRSGWIPSHYYRGPAGWVSFHFTDSGDRVLCPECAVIMAGWIDAGPTRRPKT